MVVPLVSTVRNSAHTFIDPHEGSTPRAPCLLRYTPNASSHRRTPFVTLDPQVVRPDRMEIFVNDQPHEVPDKTTVAELLAQLAVEPRHVAVEVNLQLVPRARHAECCLADGDRLEVVTLVGGG